MPCTHGRTCEEAIHNSGRPQEVMMSGASRHHFKLKNHYDLGTAHNGEEVIEMYLESWQAEGEPIPEPRTLQVA